MHANNNNFTNGMIITKSMTCVSKILNFTNNIFSIDNNWDFLYKYDQYVHMLTK